MNEFKLHDKVYCNCRGQNGVIVTILDSDIIDFPLIVDFDGSKEEYTIDGRQYHGNPIALQLLKQKELVETSDIHTRNSGMKREDKAGKVLWDLLHPRGIKLEDSLLYGFAKHMTNGAVKHGARNWEKSDINDMQSYRDGIFRHFEQYMNGEVDEEHHNAIMFNLMGMRTLQIKYKCDVFGTKKL